MPWMSRAGMTRFHPSSSIRTSGAPTVKRIVCSPIRRLSFCMSGRQYFVALKTRARSLVETYVAPPIKMGLMRSDGRGSG
jgi:hypothetical protein